MWWRARLALVRVAAIRRLHARRADLLLRLVSGGVRRALRLLQCAIDLLAPLLDGRGRLAAQIAQAGLRLILPLLDALLQLGACQLAPLRGEQQPQRRADGAAPDERAHGLHPDIASSTA